MSIILVSWSRKYASTPQSLTFIRVLAPIALIYGKPNGSVHKIINSEKSKILPYTGLNLVHLIAKEK